MSSPLSPIVDALDRRLISVKKTLDVLGIGRTGLYELIAAGKLKTVKIGRRRFVTAEALNQFIASLSA